jgi:ribosomal protein S18 acetylase RimI-like enzyme
VTPEPTDAPTEADRAAIRALLVAHNETLLGSDGPATRPYAVLLRGPEGTVQGGLIGRSGLGWMYVEYLAIPPALRGQGLGSRLMDMVEAEAAVRGCLGVRLDTFQARDFYAARGYSVFGTLPDCPPGHTRFSMMRRFGGN